ncbi:MAG TPA: class I SAM-dependent methyltransferase [Stellaceae bacterium]|nr:class I SAM-dependent methyltransferase [Stellaceae bacterium]
MRKTVLRDRGEEEFRRDAAARSLRLSLRQVDADALPFADESFDCVLSWNTGCPLPERYSEIDLVKDFASRLAMTGMG